MSTTDAPIPSPGLFHLHIPKTAGTSLRSAYFNNNYNTLTIDSDFVYDPGAHAAVALFSGHAGYRAVSASPALRDRVVTILRDPADRLVSYYYYLVRQHREGLETSERVDLASKYSFDEFLSIKDHPHLLADMYNTVTWQLVYGASLEERLVYRLENPRMLEADIVERAKANLSSFLVVGFQSDMDDFAQRLKQATGFSMPMGADNVNAERVALDALDAPTRRRLGGWIEMDMEIYEWAKARFARS